jgi:hypothetical protein
VLGSLHLTWVALFVHGRFDVILIDPPWEEYARRAPSMVEDNEVWTWEQIMELDISGIADSPCFVFL